MMKNFNIEDFKKDCAEFELDADLLLEKMENWDSKQWALFERVGETANYVEDISDLEIDDSEINFDGEELLILTDDEAESAYEEELDNYFNEVILPEIPERYQCYIDYEKWHHDARIEGSRGDSLALYDGYEDMHKIEYDNGEKDYIYVYKRG